MDRDDYRVECFGSEREPVVVIDDFSGRIDALTRLGRQAEYRPVQGYPGIRSPLDPAYLAPREALLQRVLAECFGFTGGAQIESCAFSIVTLRPEELSPGQRRPHHDASDPNLIALLHFTGSGETGGTTFYRHRRTGFEAIRPERAARFAAAVREDDAAYGAPPRRYMHGSDERYEAIGQIEARPDRVIIYRGRVLHSGHIPQSPDPETARETGRLTINTFLNGVP
jgi:hypothetical protein